MSATIVPYESSMGPGIVAVVRSVHDEYGFTWESGGYHRDLYDVEGFYLSPGGAFWVLLEEGRVIGCVGVTPHGDHCELHRLYMFRNVRARGLGRRLLKTAIEWGRTHGFGRMIAWSDVKLGLAHRLYLAEGFVLIGQRECDDPDRSIEHGFEKRLI